MSHTEFDKVIDRGSVEETLLGQIDLERLPTHIAIIMDGNGRWAQSRKLPRVEGHRAGIASVRETVETCARLGIKVLTLFAFSVENWKRPRSEVDTLMKLLKQYLRRELSTLMKNNIRFEVSIKYSFRFYYNYWSLLAKSVTAGKFYLYVFQTCFFDFFF